MVKSTTGTTFLKETIPTDRAKKFILTLLAAARSMLESFEIKTRITRKYFQIKYSRTLAMTTL
ncbi:MAG: hypothetical protein WAL79_03690 [Nitrososphaeraceae archaeon]